MLLQMSLHSTPHKHEINVEIDVQQHRIKVMDVITFPEDFLEEHPEPVFTLNAELVVEPGDSRIIIENTGSGEDGGRVPVKTYRVRFRDNDRESATISIRYSGVINDDIVEGAAEYARGFSETSGIISEKGIYLAGSTRWVPDFRNAGLSTFTLDVSIDQEWEIVSQGTRTGKEIADSRKHMRYESPEPMDEIYLVGGKWTEYTVPSDRVLFQAFLRTPDKKLAMKYLGATQGFLSMYEQMIGPYPFTKFALVENFWETGYGMPSFTLLGPKVIRFPWILYSSYPHELLHNYWGNGVYVDYDGGNWCEGITAYMADHLFKEQQGQGAEYRQATLQKYTDFVNPENDFPLAGFISRNNPAEEAIGYGKCLMMNNMLRDAFGDKKFLKAYSDFYEEYKFVKAGFTDIQASFEQVTGEDLSWFFKQWVERAGAPSLVISEVSAAEKGSGYELSFRLVQSQKEDPFRLSVPVYIYLEGEKEVFHQNLSLKGREETYSLVFTKRPVRIEVDPEFQIFRRLDRNEVPTTLTQLFGARESMVILPSGGPATEEFRKMAGIWKSTQEAQGKKMEIVRDNEISELPGDITVWVFGYDNAFAAEAAMSEKYRNALKPEEGKLADSLRHDGAVVFSLQNPLNKEQTLGFVGSSDPEAVGGLTRKLPHYGKYSYLGFEGKAPDNVLKGVFPALGSPLNRSIAYSGKTFKTTAVRKPRKALVE